jgi:hypothetical protein
VSLVQRGRPCPSPSHRHSAVGRSAAFLRTAFCWPRSISAIRCSRRDAGQSERRESILLATSQPGSVSGFSSPASTPPDTRSKQPSPVIRSGVRLASRLSDHHGGAGRSPNRAGRRQARLRLQPVPEPDAGPGERRARTDGVDAFRTGALEVAAGDPRIDHEFVTANPDLRLIAEPFVQVRQALGTRRALCYLDTPRRSPPGCEGRCLGTVGRRQPNNLAMAGKRSMRSLRKRCERSGSPTVCKLIIPGSPASAVLGIRSSISCIRIGTA